MTTPPNHADSVRTLMRVFIDRMARTISTRSGQQERESRSWGFEELLNHPQTALRLRASLVEYQKARTQLINVLKARIAQQQEHR